MLGLINCRVYSRLTLRTVHNEDVVRLRMQHRVCTEVFFRPFRPSAAMCCTSIESLNSAMNPLSAVQRHFGALDSVVNRFEPLNSTLNHSTCDLGIRQPWTDSDIKDHVWVLAEADGPVYVTLSHHISELGLLERENAAILNAALRPLAAQVVPAFSAALRALGMSAPLYLTANDGTLISAEAAVEVRAL